MAAVIIDSRALGQSGQEIPILHVDAPIERDLQGGDEHAYRLSLGGGQYAALVVEQRGIDVVVRVSGQDGKLLAEFDTERRKEGNERFGLTSEPATEYRLIVRAKYPKDPTGKYQVRVEEIRPATEQDRLGFEADKLSTWAGFSTERENSMRPDQSSNAP